MIIHLLSVKSVLKRYELSNGEVNAEVMQFLMICHKKDYEWSLAILVRVSGCGIFCLIVAF